MTARRSLCIAVAGVDQMTTLIFSQSVRMMIFVVKLASE